ncbi:hypothetical protein V493_04427 [Pseudogymnoascus sp. VKM F-4281 (FW-2241)]|nr:hypothetical protein V493_04427 [Pseudogymnoascus sp. VKM F-4281 (FW-2241)]
MGKFTYAALAALLVATGDAQSKNPGLGVNSHAEGATEEVTPGAGPNGSEDWLNTGLTGNGWEPPHLALEDVIHISRPDFYAGVGSRCQQYDSYFQKGGDGHGIDPVILAIIAMQESSCNADAGGPTPGLMQVSCANYPNGVCTDSIQDNVDAGANYLRGQLDAANGNAVSAFGKYNGWFTAGLGLNGNRGLTTDYPCSEEVCLVYALLSGDRCRLSPTVTAEKHRSLLLILGLSAFRNNGYCHAANRMSSLFCFPRDCAQPTCDEDRLLFPGHPGGTGLMDPVSAARVERKLDGSHVQKGSIGAVYNQFALPPIILSFLPPPVRNKRSQSFQTNHLLFTSQPTAITMRFSILPIALLASTVVADGAAILAAMNKISASTTKLNGTIADFHGGLIGLAETIPILIQSTTLLNDIKEGTETAEESNQLTVDETIKVSGATTELVKGVQTSLQTIVDTKPEFDELLVISPVILLNLQQQKSATAKFSKAVISKLPEEFRGIAEGIVAPIDVAFDSAIAAYKKFF